VSDIKGLQMPDNDLIDDLKDLLHQATVERSHYYTGRCIERAIVRIMELEIQVRELKRWDD